jgi:hypothetical protein
MEFVPQDPGLFGATSPLDLSVTLDPLTGRPIERSTPLSLADTIPSIPQVFLRGDANDDGGLDNWDTNLILQDTGKPLTGIDDPRDYDSDGRISIFDARRLGLAIQANTDKTAPSLVVDLIGGTNGVTNAPALEGSLTDSSHTIFQKPCHTYRKK